MAKENFFDFREKQASRPASAEAKSEPLTVSQLTARIEQALKGAFPRSVYVKGEVSNLNIHRASGHIYFTLKDAGACIDCVMFRSDAQRLKFTPEDGIELLVTGRIAVYPQRGRYQLYATTLTPLGKGALELAFRQLCEKLEKEGLFAESRKKPLPQFPRRIALVTSRATAALQDMLKVLRRFPWISLYLYHVPVQGDGSAEQIAEALRHLNERHPDLGGLDLILLGRGGGSLEDLWEFNEEVVARAIVASKIPVVTGIGHEVDVSVADLVADYHAHTPTEAAQVVTSNWRIVKDQLNQARSRLIRGLRAVSQDARHRLVAIARHEFFRRPVDRINQLRQLLDDRQRALQFGVGARLRDASEELSRLNARLNAHHPRHVVELNRQHLTEAGQRLRFLMAAELKTRRQRIDAIQRHLDAVSPQSVLQRGYTITTRKKDGKVVKSAADAKVGERLHTQFADGTIESIVEDQKQLPLFE